MRTLHFFKICLLVICLAGLSSCDLFQPKDLEQGIVAIPAFSPAAAVYTSEQKVTITCATKNAEISYYTPDSDFAPYWQKYTGPITIRSTTTIEAMASRPDWETSDISTCKFYIIDHTHTDVMTDIDGNIYQTVKIGDQWWMAENYKVTHYRNGDPISYYESDSLGVWDWKGAYSYYENNKNNKDECGALYNWDAVKDERNIAPDGWHVPTDDEWKQLEMYLGMSPAAADSEGYRGTNEGNKMKYYGMYHGRFLHNDSTFNASGLSLNASGIFRYYNGWPYQDMATYGYYWSATVNDYSPIGRYICCYDSRINRSFFDWDWGVSIRLVKD